VRVALCQSRGERHASALISNRPSPSRGRPFRSRTDHPLSRRLRHVATSPRRLPRPPHQVPHRPVPPPEAAPPRRDLSALPSEAAHLGPAPTRSPPEATPPRRDLFAPPSEATPLDPSPTRPPPRGDRQHKAPLQARLPYPVRRSRTLQDAGKSPAPARAPHETSAALPLTDDTAGLPLSVRQQCALRHCPYHPIRRCLS
jgi:hypothetical protein